MGHGTFCNGRCRKIVLLNDQGIHALTLGRGHKYLFSKRIQVMGFRGAQVC